VTPTHITPQWTAEYPWTAIVLWVVPMPDLPVPAEDLVAAVTAAVRSDVIAFDLVTVVAAPTVDGSPERDDAAAASLLPVIEAGGHEAGGHEAGGPKADGREGLPGAVFAGVVVGGDAPSVERAASRLSEHPRLRSLRARMHPQVVTSLEHGVIAIGRVVGELMSALEQDNATALDGHRPEPAQAIVPPAADRPVRPGRAAPAVTRVDGTAPRRAPFWRRGRAGSGSGEPVLTEPYWLDHLAATAGAAALVQLVLVPDYEPPTKAIAHRRRTVALALDEALGRVAQHPAGHDLNVALEALLATSPLTRCTALRPAGILAPDELPTVPVDYFDIYDVGDELVQAQVRATRALTRRRIEVTSVHLVVLATTAPLYHDEAAERFDELVRHARVSWLHFGGAEQRGLSGPGETLPDEFAPDSPDRVTRYSDHADVVSEVLGDAEDLYGVPVPPFTDDDDHIDGDDDADPEAATAS
jgi:hypothetical protein